MPAPIVALDGYLREWRRSLGYTQAQAAAALGMPLRTIQAWEAGRPTRYVSDTLVRRACRDVQREVAGG